MCAVKQGREVQARSAPPQLPTHQRTFRRAAHATSSPDKRSLAWRWMSSRSSSFPLLAGSSCQRKRNALPCFAKMAEICCGVSAAISSATADNAPRDDKEWPRQLLDMPARRHAPTRRGFTHPLTLGMKYPQLAELLCCMLRKCPDLRRHVTSAHGNQVHGPRRRLECLQYPHERTRCDIFGDLVRQHARIATACAGCHELRFDAGIGSRIIFEAGRASGGGSNEGHCEQCKSCDTQLPGHHAWLVAVDLCSRQPRRVAEQDDKAAARLFRNRYPL